jgi:hypothetical protein
LALLSGELASSCPQRREKAAMCSDYSDEGLKANTVENIFDLKLCSEILIQSKPQIELCGRCQLQVILGRIEWFKFTSVSVIIVVTFKPALGLTVAALALNVILFDWYESPQLSAVATRRHVS